MFTNRLCGALAMSGAALVCSSAFANVPVIEPRPAPVLEQTVQELLDLDASRALAAEREKMGASTVGHAPTLTVGKVSVEQITEGESEKQEAKPQPQQVKLAAIYGVGSYVQAQVVIDGSPVTFATGRPQPVRGKAPGWTLHTISTPCVTLKQPDGNRLQLCSYRADNVGKVL